MYAICCQFVCMNLYIPSSQCHINISLIITQFTSEHFAIIISMSNIAINSKAAAIMQVLPLQKQIRAEWLPPAVKTSSHVGDDHNEDDHPVTSAGRRSHYNYIPPPELICLKT